MGRAPPNFAIVGCVSCMLCVRYFFQPGWLSKIFPIGALSLYSFAGDSRYSTLIGLGLVASMGGDIALELDEGNFNYFISGLVCFLIAHLLYIAAFTQIKISWSTATIVAGFLSIYYFSLMAVLLPHVETDLIIPVAIYGLVICSMIFTAIVRFFNQDKIAFTTRLTALIGSVFFGISDTVLAVNKFRAPFEKAKIAVMFTYYIAQTFIAISALESSMTIQKKDE